MQLDTLHDIQFGAKRFALRDGQRYLVGLRPTLIPMRGESGDAFVARMERIEALLYADPSVHQVEIEYHYSHGRVTACCFAIQLIPQLVDTVAAPTGRATTRGQRGGARVAA